MKLAKFRFSAAAALVWRSGMISSSFESCSNISLAVLKISQWNASLPSLFKSNSSFSKLLITFRQTDKSFGVKRETARRVLLTGSRRRSISSLIASKITFFLFHTRHSCNSSFYLTFFIWALCGRRIWSLQNPIKNGRLLIWEFSAADWCSTQPVPLGRF